MAVSVQYGSRNLTEGSDKFTAGFYLLKDDGTNQSYELIISIGGLAGDDALTALSPTRKNGGLVVTFYGQDYSYGGTSIYGGSGNDTLTGGTGDDSLDGGDDNDLLNGGAGDDLLSGGAGLDILNGGDGNDELQGYFEAGDVLDGGAGDDKLFDYSSGATTLRGGVGDDKLYSSGGGGADIFDGGEGDDTLIVVNADISAAKITGVEHLRGNYSGGYSSVTLSAAQLNAFKDVGTIQEGGGLQLSLTTSGTVGANVLGGIAYGSVGAAAGDDTVSLGHATGSWAVYGRAGNDRITTGSGADNLNGDEGNDLLNGGAGDDLLSGGAGLDILNGGDGNDELQGYFEAGDVLDGGAGDDKLFDYSSGATTLRGGVGDDKLYSSGGGGADIFDGGEGDDTLIVVNADISAAKITGVEHLRGNYSGGYSSVTLSAAQLNAFKDVGTIQEGGGLQLSLTTSGTVGANVLGGIAYGSVGAAAGDDTVSLGHATGSWAVYGRAGNDHITTGVGADSLDGGDGDDFLDGGAGADTLQGGAGNDIYIVDNIGDNVIDHGPETDIDSIVASVDWSLEAGSSIEYLIADLDSQGLTLRGNERNNILVSEFGSNRLEGGAGNDIYIVHDLSDQVVETRNGGTDAIITETSWTLAEDSNIEQLFASGDDDLKITLIGNSADNIISGGSLDTLIGRKGNDIYYVSAAEGGVIEAKGEGFDEVQVQASYTLARGQEIEALSILKPNSVILESTIFELTGGWDDILNTADINLTGNEFAQTITGNAGANVLDGGRGIDEMRGGAGNDIYKVDNPRDVVVETAGKGRDTVIATISYGLAASQEIEGLQTADANGTGAINFTGNEFAQTLLGNNGVNVLDGRGGADKMIGYGGNDIYVVDNAGDVVTEAANGGIDTIQSSINLTLAANVENLTLTGTVAVKGTGNALANAITGNGAANVLDGGAGADTLSGGVGNDTYIVDNAGDVVIEAANGGTDTIRSSINLTLAANVENLTLTGTVAVKGTGNALANAITGNGAANVLDGAAGADTLSGGVGNDTYIVDNTGDRVFEAKGGGADRVATSVSYTLGAGQEIETLATIGTAGIKLTGNEIANTIIGNAGANVLNGGLGHDVLTGGRGADTFVFSTTLGTGNVDRITDFSVVDDTIQLSKSIFTALAAGTTLAATAFKDLSVAGAKVDADDRILYNKATGSLAYDADGSGSKAAVKFAVIDTKVTLTNADFFVL